MTICMLITAFIGILLALFIAKGYGAPVAEKYFWGLHRHDWGDIHTVFSMALIALVILHFSLHLAYVRKAIHMHMKTTFGIGVLCILLFTAALMLGAMKIAKTGKYAEKPCMKGTP